MSEMYAALSRPFSVLLSDAKGASISIDGRDYVLSIQPPDEQGDGTVPTSSAAAQIGKPGVQQASVQRGFEHQHCFNHPWARWAALYAIGSISQVIPKLNECVEK